MSRLFSIALLAALALTFLACKGPAEPAATEAKASAPRPIPEPKLGPTTIVATVNGENITLADLDREGASQLRQVRKQAIEQEHAVRQGVLEAVVAQRLVQAEAKKRGLTEEELIKVEVEDKLSAPTEAQLREFYANNQARMPGPYEQVKDQIGAYLQGQGAQGKLIEYLQQLKSGAQVALTLPPPQMPRVEVEAVGPSKGPAGAPVTMVVFSDFECPYCARSKEVIDQVVREYGDRVRIVFRDFPLPFHANAPKAAEAALCANEQGKFWEFHDHLFAHQDKLEPAALKEAARTLGLDGGAFDDCLDGGTMTATVEKNLEAGREAGVTGTPAFFINGLPLEGAQPYEAFKQALDLELGIPAAAANSTPAGATTNPPGQG